MKIGIVGKSRYIDADALWNNRPQIPKGKEGEWVQGFEYCRSIFSKQIRKQIDHNSVDGVEKRIIPIYAVRKIHSENATHTHIAWIKEKIAQDLADYLLKEGFIHFSEDKQGEAITICGLFNIVDERSENGK
jgi:hypothetical protein